MDYARFEALPAADLHGMSARVRNAVSSGLHKGYGHELTVGEIIAASDKDILQTPNLGKKSPSETPFMSVRSNVELDQHEWRTA